MWHFSYNSIIMISLQQTFDSNVRVSLNMNQKSIIKEVEEKQ